MVADMLSGLPGSTLQRWYETLADRDPKLFAELSARLRTRLESEAITTESVAADPAAARRRDLVLETIVREGRPALTIRDDGIVPLDDVEAGAREIVNRLMAAAPVIAPVIPLVGRIDVLNFPSALNYVGTGWLVDAGIIVTNRHVADLIARRTGEEYVFRPGRFGDPIEASLDFRRELGGRAGTPVRVRRVVWIEPDAKKADIAFLELERAGDGARPTHVTLADGDAAPNTNVAVIGYPARAPSDAIPDQEWMDRIYARTYDVKRIAPGLMGEASRGWATHDCTTLGGNSGSVVVDVGTGRAVALHFAGLYMIENYAVPASTIRSCLRQRPWHPDARPRREEITTVTKPADARSVSFVVPLTISIALGEPVIAGAPNAPAADAQPAAQRAAASIDDAARALLREHRGNGVLAVRAGFVLQGDQLTDQECLVVAAHPDKLEAVRQRVPGHFAGWVVEVRAASVQDQLGVANEAVVAEAVTSIAYNDDDRAGAGFSFTWVDEPMTVVLHVGPERSWKMLSGFLAQTEHELVSSIYEFHAQHIAAGIEKELKDGVKMTLVAARQSRDPKNNRIAAGDFDRRQTFERWGDTYEFERVFVPTGMNGLIASSYHIKVTVRDGRHVWLSSGNWKQSSQPLITGDLDDPVVTSGAGNREWHVLLTNDTLATRFGNHIRADYERSIELGGTPEAIEEQVMVDVPAAVLKAIRLEGPPSRVLPEKELSRRIRVKPLLTPDRQGAVYSDAVLELIRSAERQLLFQIPYITIMRSTEGYLDELVTALLDKARTIDDVRIIMRSDGDGFWDNLAELKRRYRTIQPMVRRLPKTHTKGMVVDGRRVLIGSHNWSTLGVTLNRDASLLFDDAEVAEYFREAFEIDWDRAGRAVRQESAVAAGAPRVAVGPEPPDGFVRMPLAQYLDG